MESFMIGFVVGAIAVCVGALFVIKANKKKFTRLLDDAKAELSEKLKS